MLIATNSSKLNISVEKNTAAIARKFSSLLKKGNVLFLYGEIGVGKTTFVRYLINDLQKKNNIKISEITSPTFNIVNEYYIKKLTVQHYDLFRLNNIEETKNIGLLENYEDVLTIVEWPEKIQKKPKNVIELFFEYGKNLDYRFLSVKGIDIK